jgi:hypothetical protein
MGPPQLSGAELTGLHHGPLLCVKCRASHVGYTRGPSSVSGAGLAIWAAPGAPALYEISHLHYTIAGSFFCMRDGLATCATLYSIGGPPLYMYMQNRQPGSQPVSIFGTKTISKTKRLEYWHPLLASSAYMRLAYYARNVPSKYWNQSPYKYPQFVFLKITIQFFNAQYTSQKSYFFAVCKVYIFER